MKLQQQSIVAVLVALLFGSAFAHATLMHRSTSNLRSSSIREVKDSRQGQVQRRNLATTREEYTADVFLRWDSDAPITAENSVILAENAKSFITRNIPATPPGESSGIVALGIVSVLVVDQSFSYTTPSTAFLRVQLEVQGIVIADSDFEKDSFNFNEIINIALRANDDEFLRLVEPLVFSGDESDDPSEGKSIKTLLIVLIVVVSLLIVVVVLFMATRVYQKWQQGVPRKGRLPSNNKEVPAIALEETDSSGSPDSVDEQSIYTMRESAPNLSMRSSSVVDSSQTEHNSTRFIGWSFSMSSDGEGDGSSREFDTRSSDDDPRRVRYTLENVDDISIGKDGDVFEDIDLDDDEDDGTGTYASSAGGAPPALDVGQVTTMLDNQDKDEEQGDMAPILDIGQVTTMLDKEDNDEEQGEMDTSGRLSTVDEMDTSGRLSTVDEMDTSGRLSIADMHEFDDYVSRLPAPHKYQTRGKHERRRKRMEI